MKTSNIFVLIALIAVQCPAVLSVQAAPRSTPVTVVNDAAAPVPITGVVDTNVVGTPGVTIENSPAQPVPITGVGAPTLNQIYHLRAASGATGAFACGASGSLFSWILPSGSVSTNPFNIPTGAQFIVTSISFVTENSSANTSIPFAVARTTAAFGNTAFQSRVLTDSTGAGASVTTLSPGVTTSISLCFIPPPTGTSSIDVYGYLVDVN